ncbi:hypothetical protein N7495_006355 [Penicillium taxi]|uniref:uncharacterized protein n=1 Tax=Penicillium taxi TaxID=168475 RepID=UPI0025455147|nr:uncharacterized protein N7495_006355 [Penicillium taxi]KAJ5894664.1 hypothetical protein N7495_006355 [Penicillium taxi]
MDVILDVVDTFALDRFYAFILPDKFATGLGNNTLSNLNEHVKHYYPLEASHWAEASAWKRDHIGRQLISFMLIMWIFGVTLYLLGSWIILHTMYDKRLFKHPRYLKNQMPQEIMQGMIAMPIMAILTAPFFVLETRGYSKLYDFTSDSPFAAYTWLQYPIFVVFTDTGIYWIHRWLHLPSIYPLHKPHHKWVVPTPFTSYAFHPLDGWAQSLPYHIFPFIFPLQKCAYLGLFAFVTFWTLFIHDAEYLCDSTIFNGPGCHTMHHLYFNYNYGQYVTLWDRLGGTYRKGEEDKFIQEQNRKKIQ